MVHEKYRHVTELRAQTDGLLVRLSEGENRSPNVRANNLTHLKMAFALLPPFMDDPRFLAWLKQRDAVMESETVMTVRVFMAPLARFQDLFQPS